MAYIKTSGMLSVLLISTFVLSNQEADTDKYIAEIKNEQLMSKDLDNITEKRNEKMFTTGKTAEQQFYRTLEENEFENDQDINMKVDVLKERVDRLEKELREKNNFSNVNLVVKLLEEKFQENDFEETESLIKNKVYDYAAVKLAMINDDDRIKNVTITAYKNTDLNMDTLIDFIKHINDVHQRYLFYKALYTYIISNEQDQCDKHVKLSNQLQKDKEDQIFPDNMTELNDESDAFNKFFLFVDPDEILVAIKCQNYTYAASQLSLLNNCDRKFINFIITAYKSMNVEISISFAESFDNTHQRYIAYKTLYTELMKSGKLTEDIKKLFEESICARGYQYYSKMSELYDRSHPFNSFIFNRGLVGGKNSIC